MSKSTAASTRMDDEAWRALRHEVLSLFTPGSPVDEKDLFAGRQDQIQKLQDTVVSRGRHAVIFGERGVGKTSLSNIFFLGLFNINNVRHIYIQCVKDDTFETIWRKAFRRIKFTIDGQEMWADEMVKGDLTPDEIEIMLSNFTSNDVPIIVFDEFDRISDQTTRKKMSETIKQLSNANSTSTCTLVIVGVGESVIELIEEHKSVSRALVQVQMPRMHSDELKEIVATRIRRTILRITDGALWRIAFLSSGLPFYAHALGQSAALTAVSNKSHTITEDMVDYSIAECFKELDQSLIDSYVKATVETRKGNIFREVLAGCSLAEQDELGRFSAASVEAPLSEILGKEMKTPSFAFHLNELCGVERGNILQKSGQKGLFRYRFIEPIMQPYITLKSLSDKIVKPELLERFSIQRQRSFSI